MKSKPGVKYSGNLKKHWSWSLGLSFTLFLLAAAVFWIDHKAGFVVLAFTVVYLGIVLLLYLRFRSRILNSLLEFASSYEQTEGEMLRQIEIPVTMVDMEGRVIWMNEAFSTLTERPEKFSRNINVIFPELAAELLPVSGPDKDIQLLYKERDYVARIQRVSLTNLIQETELLEEVVSDAGSFFYMIYLIDETELNQLRQENHDQKNAVALAYIDNYEEALDGIDEVHSSLMNVLVDREINKYFSTFDCLARKLEKDKYLIVMNQKSLDRLTDDHFSILEEVKTVNIGNDVGMTISIGVGMGGSYQQNHDFARSAIEMALGRGGDQAVVNRESQMTFYGGKSQRNEKNTRVKARVKAQAMREIMESKERVLTMGHQITDMDSLGAAVGIFRAAKTLGKPAYIVIGENTGSVDWWIDALRSSKEYEEDIFISHEQAIEMTNMNTAVVVVDTARTTMVECGEILSMTNTVVVLDHHRQTTEQITGAALSYIEPSASSACEMVAEVLQYFEEDVRLRGLEADCMYAGIIIDTNNFVAKTGARTFEAAAYLRRAGADATRVRKALRDDMDSYKARAEAVRHAEAFMGCYMISILPAGNLATPNVTAAQAANELLNINGVKASFVVTEYDSRVFISARAIDEVNVQLVMEHLGGGGHMTIAGAQLTGVSCEEAVEEIRRTLTQMTEAGEI